MAQQEFLIITQEEIEGNFSMSDFIPVVEEGFREFARGRVTIPPKVVFEVRSGAMACIPAYAAGSDALTIKIGNHRDDNPAQGLPYISGAQVFLYDSETGLPLSLMDGTSITALRTGAMGGVAAKYLARPDSRVVGIIGAGVQGRSNLAALDQLFDIRTAYVAERCDETRNRYIREMSERLGLDIKPATIEEAARKSDILACVTGTSTPLVKAQWLHPGMHITTIGSDGPEKQEVETEVLKRSRIFLDWFDQCEYLGDISQPLQRGDLSREDIAGELGHVILGQIEGRQSGDQITLFDASGPGFLDSVSAKMIYRAALEKGLGTKAHL